MVASDKEDSLLCHGRHAQLLSCSTAKKIGFVTKRKNRLSAGFSNMIWHVRTKGILQTIKYSFRKFLRKRNETKDSRTRRTRDGRPTNAEEVLNLQPGELVEIRPEEEILATLDENGKFRNLAWMTGMNRHCGKRYRVYKRLETMLLESTGEYRKIKNTVLLEGLMCDGKAFNNCGRSCFFLWREIWLKRVEENVSK